MRLAQDLVSHDIISAKEFIYYRKNTEMITRTGHKRGELDGIRAENSSLKRSRGIRKSRSPRPSINKYD